MNQSQAEEEEPSTSGFYRQQREAAPFVKRRRFHRKSPSRRPHRRMPYPPSPQYRGNSTSEDEAVQVPAAKGRYTDPTRTPIPRDELASTDQEESGEEGDSSGYVTPPPKQPLETPSNCTLPCPTSWTEPYRRLWINQAPPA